VIRIRPLKRLTTATKTENVNVKTRNIQLAIMATGLAGAMSASAVTLTFDGVSPEEDVTLQVSGAFTFGPGGV